MRTPSVLVAALAVMVLLLSACSDGGDGDDGGTSSELDATAPEQASPDVAARRGPEMADVAADGDELAAPPVAEREEAESGTAGDDATLEAGAADADADEATGAGTEVAPVAVEPADVGRSIVFTADVTMTVDDVTAANRQAQVIVEALGGILFGQETTSDPVPRSVLTFKVRPEEFRTALDRLSGLGDVDHQTVTADDVTERVVDLESRIATAETSVTRLRELLAATTDLQGIAALEAQLLERETQLEQLRGQLRTLQDQVSLATIVVVMSEEQPDVPAPAVELAQTAYDGHDGGDGCPGDDDVRADEDDELTICFAVTNTGNTLLGGVEVSDDALGADPDDLVVVEGDITAPLAAGERVLLAWEATAGPDTVPAPEVSATALDDDGEPLRIEVVSELEPVALDVAPDTSLPGFADSLAAGGRAAQWLFGVALLGVGAVLPFAWVPALAAGAWLLYRRRHSAAEAG